jgi:Holliday junction DNA helicase RuvB
VGNPAAVARLQESIKAAEIQEPPVPHVLLYGSPGTGKTTLARLVAASTGGRFFETTASALESHADLLRLLWAMNDAAEVTGKASTLFIDEIHRLGASRSGERRLDQEGLFPVLEDFVFHHNLQDKEITIGGSEIMVDGSTFAVRPFTCIGATTDPGMLSAALLRRFLTRIQIAPYAEAEIAEIIIGSAIRLNWPIDREAAVELAKYARRNPGEAYSLLTNARERALATGRDMITAPVVGEIIGRMELYALGLNSTDLRILRMLANRPKGMGQAEIARSCNIAVSTFSNIYEPYLSLLGFVQTLHRRMITPVGVAYLSSLEA